LRAQRHHQETTVKARTISAGVLQVAYLEHGPADGWPCVMGHGFPYDAHAYDASAELLARAGARVIVPWLRGFGATRFLSPDTPRSGEQAVLGADLLALLDALRIGRAVLGGYDWGGRACCVVSALWPERVVALVSANTYNIQNIARALEPAATAAKEAALWYQYYFHSERGRRGLERNRRDIARTLWRMWSPTWGFDEATFARSAPAFDNPDFVEVVIHSYRHRFALVPGDPAVAAIEERLASQPTIAVPAVTLDGRDDGLRTDTTSGAPKFTGPHEHRFLDGCGHNPPQEQPAAWVDAVLRARALASLSG
jgi:pimeloyl-ACP methyl ester carboxylesterase